MNEIEILVNGKAVVALGDGTILDLLVQIGMAGKRVAVECNREIVPRSTYGERKVCDGDRFEIVVAVGGG